MKARFVGVAALVLVAGTANAFELMRINKDPCRRGEQNLFWRSEAVGVSVAFLDPPYGEGLAVPALAALAGEGWLAPGAIVSVEIGRRESLPPPDGFEALDVPTSYGGLSR